MRIEEKQHNFNTVNTREDKLPVYLKICFKINLKI